MLKYRIITAFILIPITLLVLFYLPQLPFILLMSFITLGAAWEWASLMGLKTKKSRLAYLAIVILALYAACYVPIEILFAGAFLWWLLATLLIILYPRGNHIWGRGYWVRGTMGLLVLVPCWAAVNFIRHDEGGDIKLLFLFILIWGADSAAYFVGRKWGKRKLAPHVSPGKSTEGVLGAFIFTILFVLIAFLSFGIPRELWLWGLLLSLATVLFSIIGDLFESMLKREVGVKDSGRLLPGHGGLLDRIDSLTAAAPVFVFGSLLIGHYI